MPKTNHGTCDCINGCGPMTRQEDFNLLSKIESTKPLKINPASGLPMKVYVCMKCGYMESYIGQSEGLEL